MVKEGSMKKGDVLGVARVAGIMGAKRTSELIPLCHLLNLTKLTVDFTIHEETNEIEAVCTARTVFTSQITAVCNGDPHIIDFSSRLIPHFLPLPSYLIIKFPALSAGLML